MAMDASDAALLQQTTLLQEIRDELRTTRGMSSAMASGTASAGAHHGASGAGFAARAQAMSDKVLAGEFANFGWTQAFQPIYKTTAFQDIAATMGLSRAPNTLTQPEYQSLAAENFGIRVHNFVGGVMSPGFTSRTNSLADEIFANSPRFARAGNSSSVLGTGMSRSASTHLARGLQLDAMTNPRLSGSDMSTITTVGMQSGQFDNASGAGDFRSKVQEFANAVADATRTMRVSVEEAARSMGALHSVGITGVGAQRDTMLAMGAAAQVAGMTNAEMMGVGMGAAGTGLGLGLSGQASMVGVARLTAQMREATQAGVVDKFVMARGGGAAAVASDIFNVEAQFASSDAGFYSHLGRAGGRGGGYIDELAGGVAGVAGGGYYGVLRSQRNRTLMTSQMTDEDRRSGMRSYVQQQIGLHGITDFTSDRAQDIAFDVVRGMGMGDSAAQAYTATNFSAEGQRASERARMGMYRSQAMMEKKLELDNEFARTSFPGRLQQVRGRAAKWWGEKATGIGDYFTPESYSSDFDATSRGLKTHHADAMTLGRIISSISSDPGTLDLYDPIGAGGGVTADIVGWGVGLGVTAATGGFGSVIGVAAGLATHSAVSWGTELISGTVAGGANRSISGSQAKVYKEIERGMRRPNTSSGLASLGEGKVTHTSSFKQLLAMGTDIGDMNVDRSLQFTTLVADAAEKSGLTTGQVTNALAATGVTANLAGGFNHHSGGAASDRKAFEQDMKSLVGNTETGVDFTISENSTDLQGFLGAIQNGGAAGSDATVKQYALGRGAMAKMGLSSEVIQTMEKNFAAMGSAKQSGIMKRQEAVAGIGGTQKYADIMDTVKGFAGNLLGTVDASSNSQARAADAQFKTLQGAGDRDALFNAVTGDEDLGQFLRKKSKIFQDAYDIAHADLGSMTAKDISKRWNIDVGEDFEGKLQRGGPDALRDAQKRLAATYLGQTGTPESKEQDRDREISKHLADATANLKTIAATVGAYSK